MKGLQDLSEQCGRADCNGPGCNYDDYCARCMCAKCSRAVGKCPGNKAPGWEVR